MGGVDAVPIPMHGRTHSLTLTLPPLGVLFLQREAPEAEKVEVAGEVEEEPEVGVEEEDEGPSGGDLLGWSRQDSCKRNALSFLPDLPGRLKRCLPEVVLRDPVWESSLGAIYLKDQRCRFRVWAPNAESVEVDVCGSRLVLLEPREDGYFEAEVDAVPPGTPYSYRLDGERAPRPRVALQPEGVHGPSAVVDPALRRGRRGLARAPARRSTSSTSCTSAPSRPRAPSTPSSRSSTACATSASPRSS